MVLKNRTVQQFLAILILAVFVSLKKVIDTEYRGKHYAIAKIETNQVKKEYLLEENRNDDASVFRLTAQY